MLHKNEMNGTANVFVTVKDYKEKLMNYPTTRFIYKSIHEIERIIKHILGQINKELAN